MNRIFFIGSVAIVTFLLVGFTSAQTVIISDHAHPNGCLPPRNDDNGGGNGGSGGDGGGTEGNGSSLLRDGGKYRIDRSDSSFDATLPADSFALAGVKTTLSKYTKALSDPSLVSSCVSGATAYYQEQTSGGLLGQVTSLFSRLRNTGDVVVTSVVGTFAAEPGSSAGARKPSRGYVFMPTLRGATPVVTAAQEGVSSVAVQSRYTSTVSGVRQLAEEMTGSAEEGSVAAYCFNILNKATRKVTKGVAGWMAVGGYVYLEERNGVVPPHILTAGVAVPKSVFDRQSSITQSVLLTISSASLTVGATPDLRRAACDDLAGRIASLPSASLSASVTPFTPKNLDHPVYAEVVNSLLESGIDPSQYEVHTQQPILASPNFVGDVFNGVVSRSHTPETSNGAISSTAGCITRALSMDAAFSLATPQETSEVSSGAVFKPVSPPHVRPRPGVPIDTPLLLQPIPSRNAVIRRGTPVADQENTFIQNLINRVLNQEGY